MDQSLATKRGRTASLACYSTGRRKTIRFVRNRITTRGPRNASFQLKAIPMDDQRAPGPDCQLLVDLQSQHGLVPLGLRASAVWHLDPRRLVFVLARYKFVAKMFSGMGPVLEIGCGDAFGTRIVQQEVGHLTAIDFNSLFVQSVLEQMDPRWKFECRLHDMLEGPVTGSV